MNRGRGRFTPSPRGRGRGGWSRPSPSSGASSDRPTQTHVGADPCSFDNISGGTSSKIDASGERSWLRNDRCSGGRRMPGQSQATWKSVQPIVGGDLSSDCTKKGSADVPVALDPSFKSNLGSLPAKSSVLSGSLSQRNERLCSGKQTSRQWYKDWKQTSRQWYKVLTYIAKKLKLNISLYEKFQAGADPSSPDHISSGARSASDGSGERSRHRNDRFRGGRQIQSGWKPVQPVSYNNHKASAGEGCSPSSGGDRTDCKPSSPELSLRLETVGDGLLQSEKSDMSSECTKKGSADRSPNGNYGSPQGNSSGSSGRSLQGNERPKGGRQTSRQWYTDWKQPQPVVASISRDRTICEITVVTSPELNYRAEIVGDDVMQSEKSDLLSNCTKKGSADGPLGLDPSLTKNPGSLHAKSSVTSKRSSQRNEWPSSQRLTSHQQNTEWVVAKPVAYMYSKQSEVPDLSSDCTVGKSKSIVLEKGSADEHLDLNRALVKNQDSDCVKSSASTEYASSPELNYGAETVGGDLMQSEKSDLSSDCTRKGSPDWSPRENLGSPHANSSVSGKSDDGPFDICPPNAGSNVVLNQSLLVMNKQRRKAIKCTGEPKGTLRSGMVLLKNTISVSDQVKLVKECRELGLGVGGFYQPRYRDGAKLSLRMMCLGKNWDPETRSYGEIRSIDDAKPPPIPSYFLELVERSIKDSRALIAKECGSTERAEDILPWMSPDICLVNFYTTGGRLGLHQDRDESQKSLEKGLPVVSISIGDWAEFLYGDEREVDKAEKVTLESGDVLIFGGESRHVFHGISSVKPDTAPKPLLKETNLRPGRLNLTFRQY